MGLHGREQDLERIDDTLAALQTGRGRALFLVGEPGIGKSTLLAQARARATGLVLAGAAWESGGAPPYWPWQQVLRDVVTHAGDRVRTLPGADRIAALVEEWGPSTSAGASDPSAARFALLDAVVRALLALAAERPLVILLDDLHAADLPTLDLLVMLVRELPRAPIALVAAWREGELAVRIEAAQRLARASRFGDVQALRRLTADEVTGWVGADGAAIYASSEGNPLFVEELLRARRGGAAPGVTSVIADHLALAGDATRELLSIASVLGRELDVALLGRLAGDDAVAAALREAAAVGIVEKTERGWRFRHVLLRDHLYDALSPSRRAELHRRIGDALTATDPARAAHHLLAGASPNAVEIARAAAARAMDVYAFEEAIALLSAALDVLQGNAALEIDLRIELATAWHHVGRVEKTRAECMKAVERSRELGDAERFARAAMVFAAELTSGTRDAAMVALLDEASRGLGDGDSALRARVIARLAAALIPGPEPEAIRAQQLAREAVAMARRIGDAEATLFALRYSAHAQAYRIAIDDSLAIALEVVELADRLHRPLEAIDHRAWLVGAHLSVGNLAASLAALEQFEALASAIPQPQTRWRVPIIRATNAMRLGNFAEADRHIAIARDIAREYDLERAGWATRFAMMSAAVCSRSPERANAIVEEMREAATKRIAAGAGNFVACLLAIAGRREEALEVLARTVFYPTLVVMQFGAEAICLLGAREYAERAVPLLEQQVALHPLAHGPQGALFLRPAVSALGELYALLGRTDDAIAALEKGLALARSIESPPGIATTAAALAPLLERRGQRERAAALAEEAARLAHACEIHGVAAAAPPPRSQHRLTIACGEDGVRVHWNGRDLRAPSAKGFEFLATLVAAPGREIHVSDLIGDDDRGDAGEVLDAKARAAYKARAEELQEELEAARARNDLGRAGRLRAELEAITDELIAATGLGGRARKAGSRVERARVNVQRRIKDAIKRLGADDESLARYLEATIRTGTFCSFVPLDS